jgi:hypothetical protein
MLLCVFLMYRTGDRRVGTVHLLSGNGWMILNGFDFVYHILNLLLFFALKISKQGEAVTQKNSNVLKID